MSIRNKTIDELAEQICNKVAETEAISILMPDGHKAEVITTDYISELVIDIAEDLKADKNLAKEDNITTSMQEQEALEIFKAQMELPWVDEMFNAFKVAIRSIEELTYYKQGGLCLVPADVYKAQCEMLDDYEEIGDIKSVEEASKKQTALKPIQFEFKNGHINYGCPSCMGKIISKIDGEWCCGRFQDYCDRCGQKLDWHDMKFAELLKVNKKYRVSTVDE